MSYETYLFQMLFRTEGIVFCYCDADGAIKKLLNCFHHQNLSFTLFTHQRLTVCSSFTKNIFISFGIRIILMTEYSEM